MNPRPTMALVAGDDELAVSDKAREFVRSVLREGEEAFGLETLDGRAESAGAAEEVLKRCREALQTVAFLGGGKVIWLRDAVFLGDLVVLKNEGVRAQTDALCEAIRAGQAGTNALLVTTSRLDKRSAFYRFWAEKKAVVECWVPEKAYQSEQVARERAREALRERGLQASEETIERLVERVGADSRMIMSEVEKLSLYVLGRREERPDDLAAVVSAARESLVWDLPDAVGRRELPDAMRILRQLLFQREQPVRLVSALGDRIRDLRLYRFAIDQGWIRRGGSSRGATAEWATVPPEIDHAFTQYWARDPRAMHPFRVLQLANQAQKYTAAELRRAHALVLDAHERLVSSGGSAVVVLDLLLVRVMRRPGTVPLVPAQSA
jgi:DNA polymerase III subunit delta